MSKGWYPVCDQVPGKKGLWTVAKVPMMGVRFIEMQDGVGYLAIRYATSRYIFEEVPQRKYEILRKHRGASMYFRQQIKDQYTCVDVKRYETIAAYQADEGPVREKLAEMARHRLEQALAPKPLPAEVDLFGTVIRGDRAPKSKRGSRSSSNGSIQVQREVRKLARWSRRDESRQDSEDSPQGR